MSISIGPADPARLPECVPVFHDSAIYERYFSQDDRLLRSLRTGAERGELYTAQTEQGRIVGVMRVVPGGFCGLYPYLALIGVDASARGQGVGGALMDAFEEMGRTAGRSRVSLMVSDFNTGAQAFYKARGYRELGRIPDAAKAGITELVYLKDL